MLLVPGCQKPKGPIVPPNLLPPPVQNQASLPTYSELIDRYNARLEGLGRVWASTDVEMRWRDAKGKERFEKGDGKFLYVRTDADAATPDNVAVTVEKLGKTLLWAGSDADRFWLFDLHEDVAYVGRHANIGKACAQDLPLPVHPSVVPHLLGLVPIDRNVVPDEPAVERIEGYYLIEPPHLKLRMLLDPATARPVRVDLTDDAGETVVIARLGEYAAVEVEGVAADRRPQMPTHADLYVSGEEARMTLSLKRISDGRDGNRIQDRVFDYNVLLKAHKPRHIVELDASCVD